MVLYEFKCDYCEILWEKHRPIAEYKKGSMCPQCKKKGKRTVGCAMHIVTDHREDIGLAKEFYTDACEGSRERVSVEGGGHQHYARYKPNLEKMKESGEVKFLNKKESRNKRNRMKKLTQDAYDKLGKNPATSNNPTQNL